MTDTEGIQNELRYGLDRVEEALREQPPMSDACFWQEAMLGAMRCAIVSKDGVNAFAEMCADTADAMLAEMQRRRKGAGDERTD